MLKKAGPATTPLADASVRGLRFEPGQRKATGKWTLRFTSPVTGKRRDMGLGTYPEACRKLPVARVADSCDPSKVGFAPVYAIQGHDSRS
jgi:hypothetical protein